jgi:hypothetical protein
MNNAVKLIRLKDHDSGTTVLINIFQIKGVYDNDDHRTVEFLDSSVTDVSDSIEEIAALVNRSF